MSSPLPAMLPGRLNSQETPMKWLAALGVLSAFAGPASACECMNLSQSRLVASAGKIFVGEILSSKVQPVGGRPDFQSFRQIVVFRVTTAFKGVRPGEVVVSDTQIGPGSCSLSTARPGGPDSDYTFNPPPPAPGHHMRSGRLDYSRWVIFDEPSRCSRSHPLPVAEADGDLEIRKIRQLVRMTH